jgi:MarR family transcriptional regulator, organic hydroperoxide resistance regulator
MADPFDPPALEADVTRTRRHRLTTEAAEIAAALDQIRRVLRASILEQTRRMSVPLTAPQLLAIETLVEELRSSNAGLSLSELSKRMGLSHSTVSGIVDRLEARGFLRRVPREDDRRFVEVQLTDSIQRWLQEELPASRANPIAQALAAASGSDRAAIRDGVLALARLLAETRKEAGGSNVA